MKNYSAFADLCMLTSGGQPWALDMRKRSAEPAAMAYMVNSLTLLLSEKPAFVEPFHRARSGVVVGSAPTDSIETAPAPMVYLALRYVRSKLVRDGSWIPGLVQVVEGACPEIKNATEGEAIPEGSAGHWSIALARGEWLSEIDALAPAREVEHAPSR